MGMFKKLRATAVFLVCWIPGFAQVWQNAPSGRLETSNLVISRYSILDGLPSKNATTVIKSRSGFIWVGTENGLCKFDGYTFKTFTNKKGDSASISNNYINALAEDAKGRIWVGTMDGLNVFDPNTEKFTRFYHKDADQGSISNDKIWSLLADSHGRVWIGTDNGFNRYTEKSHSFQNYLPNAGNPFAMKGKSVNAIVDDGSDLWLANWGEGLNKYDIKSGRFYNYKQAFPPSDRNPNDLWAAAKSNDGKIWVGSYWKGLFQFDPLTGKFQHFENPLNPQRPVFTLLNLKGNTLLVGDSETFWWFNTAAKTWEKVAGVDNDPHGHAYMDEIGLVWISSKNGLSKIDHRQNKFEYYSFNQRYHIVTSMLIRDSVIWLGADKGLIKFDFKNKTIKSYQHSADPGSLGNDQVRKIYSDPSGKLWVLTEYGFDEFDSVSGKFKHHFHHSNLGRLFNEDVFRDIEQIDPGVYGLATDAGFKIFNSKTGAFTHYYNNDNDRSGLSNNHVSCLLKDRDNQIWIGTNGGGLNRFDPKTRKFKVYLSGDKEKGGISDNTINSLFLDSKGGLWVCTPQGLDKYDKSKDSFIAYTQDNGFSGNVFNYATEDKLGNIWVTTEKGVSCFNPQNNKIDNFDEADGVFGNSFIDRDRAGNIYLAGETGFGFLNPSKLIRNLTVPPVYFTDFQVFNKSISPSAKGPLKANLNIADQITLKYDQSVFSIGFVALNYTLPGKNQYAYILEGFDKKWNYVGTQRKATYTNLDPGTYTFRVKAANNDGIWNNTGKSITIVITPPWYKTWLAYCFYLLAGMAIITAYIKYREHEAGMKYEIKLAHLRGEQEKELNERKLSFFTNVSHEFRTPLTLIINPLKEALYKEGEVDASGLSIVYRNAKRLLSLVDQLLLFRKAEAGAEKLKVERLNIVDLCKEVFLCFSHQAKLKSIRFNFISNADNVELFVDREKIEIVLFNLISNAMKFTPEEGEIALSITEEDDDVIIRVKDTGCGIDEQTGDKLYNRFYQEKQNSKQAQGGFGIGLFLAKSFVEYHKGTIDYKSNPDTGTVFSIRLLKGHGHFSGEEMTEKQTIDSTLLKELIEDETMANTSAEEANELLAESDLSAELQSMLIIDDNKDFREYLKQLFKIDYRVYDASDGPTGLKMIKQVLPEIIISDVMMEGMTGIELCAAVRDDMEISHIPFILLTSSSSSEIKLKGLEGGADDYISKPFDKDILRARVAGLLKSKNNLQKYFHNEITLNRNPHKISIEYKSFLENCITVVESHLTDPNFNLQVLASELNISHSGLYKKIKFISGQSASNFIRSIRLRKAANLFIHTDYNILEAAYMVGINDIKYFREQFKKLFGMNPSQYIKKYRKTFKNTMVNHDV
jgi:signal transduction histidine kinase/ligand-binding sensor domain-containing protein/DNA-binding response OmpR family regulator